MVPFHSEKPLLILKEHFLTVLPHKQEAAFSSLQDTLVLCTGIILWPNGQEELLTLQGVSSHLITIITAQQVCQNARSSLLTVFKQQHHCLITQSNALHTSPRHSILQDLHSHIQSLPSYTNYIPSDVECQQYSAGSRHPSLHGSLPSWQPSIYLQTVYSHLLLCPTATYLVFYLRLVASSPFFANARYLTSKTAHWVATKPVYVDFN